MRAAFVYVPVCLLAILSTGCPQDEFESDATALLAEANPLAAMLAEGALPAPQVLPTEAQPGEFAVDDPPALPGAPLLLEPTQPVAAPPPLASTPPAAPQPSPAPDPIPTPNAPSNPFGGCDGGRYVGEINGAEATANLAFNVINMLPVYLTVYVDGEISSGGNYYTFTAETNGVSGYGDLVPQAGYPRMRIQIVFHETGFVLKTGVFEGDCGAEGCGQYQFNCP